MSSEFNPPRMMGGPHWQSILSSAPPRRVLVRHRAKSVLAESKDVLLTLPDDVRLLGHLSRQPAPAAAPMAVLLHGWEGHSESSYLLATAQRLFDAGMDVFRLNLRDHGGTHELNPGVFHSCRIEEVVHAVHRINEDYARGSLYMAGFSLGGNFALRVALRAPAADIPLRRVVAISPVINAASSMRALDTGLTIYRSYFLRKWRRSLRAKQAAFPRHYEFDARLPGDLWGLTDLLVRRHTSYADADDYFDGYSVGSGRLAAMQVPTSIVTSRDDPIIPIGDFEEIPDNPAINIQVTARGGHCAFLEDWRLNSWVGTFVTDQFSVNIPASDGSDRLRQSTC